MKKNISVLGFALILSACMTSINSPEVQNALKDSRLEINDCLLEQVSKLVHTYPDIRIMSEVAADRCQYVALQEEQKLKKLNTSTAFIEGYTRRMSSKRELESQALNIIMLLIDESKK